MAPPAFGKFGTTASTTSGMTITTNSNVFLFPNQNLQAPATPRTPATPLTPRQGEQQSLQQRPGSSGQKKVSPNAKFRRTASSSVLPPVQSSSVADIIAGLTANKPQPQPQLNQPSTFGGANFTSNFNLLSLERTVPPPSYQESQQQRPSILSGSSFQHAPTFNHPQSLAPPQPLAPLSQSPKLPEIPISRFFGPGANLVTTTTASPAFLQPVPSYSIQSHPLMPFAPQPVYVPPPVYIPPLVPTLTLTSTSASTSGKPRK